MVQIAQLPEAFQFYQRLGMDIIELRVYSSVSFQTRGFGGDPRIWEAIERLPRTVDRRIPRGEAILDACWPDGYYERSLRGRAGPELTPSREWHREWNRNFQPEPPDYPPGPTAVRIPVTPSNRYPASRETTRVTNTLEFGVDPGGEEFQALLAEATYVAGDTYAGEAPAPSRWGRDAQVPLELRLRVAKLLTQDARNRQPAAPQPRSRWDLIRNL